MDQAADQERAAIFLDPVSEANEPNRCRLMGMNSAARPEKCSCSTSPQQRQTAFPGISFCKALTLAITWPQGARGEEDSLMEAA